MARKPLDGTYANNVLTHGCGELNIDGCRIPFADAQDEKESKQKNQHADFGSGPMTNEVFGKYTKDRENYDPVGRWPANIVTSDLDESWAKYFYCAKASKRDRDEGLEHLGLAESSELVDREPDSAGMNSPRAGAGRTSGRRNIHPTVKPTELMRYLCRLVTPPNGLVLDPFSGSGSTGKAATLEGFNFLGFELDPQYAEIANARCDAMREEYRKMITLAEHKDGQLTGRVAYLECSRDDLTDLLPLLGGPAPQDISKGIVTPTVFAYNAKVHGREVSVDALFRVEVAPGIWAPYGTVGRELDKRDYKD